MTATSTENSFAVRKNPPESETTMPEGQASECGCCTPEMIAADFAMLNRNAHPGERRIRDALADSFCRCGVCPRIVRAVQTTASKL